MLAKHKEAWVSVWRVGEESTGSEIRGAWLGARGEQSFEGHFRDFGFCSEGDEMPQEGVDQRVKR